MHGQPLHAIVQRSCPCLILPAVSQAAAAAQAQPPSSFGEQSRSSLNTSALPGLQLFNGLRVRMGVATGTLPPGVSLRASAILQQAKLVSDAASGGQVLMDSPTFIAVKVRSSDLLLYLTKSCPST
jgi:hypothetical protein